MQRETPLKEHTYYYIIKNSKPYTLVYSIRLELYDFAMPDYL